MLFSGLIGLGMDYDMFLVSRIREEVEKGLDDEAATVRAVEATGMVITACGLIMASALGSLTLSRLALLREMGFTMALAILLDAFLLRVLLVPSIMTLMREWSWWAPGPLRRVRRTLHHAAYTSQPT